MFSRAGLSAARLCGRACFSTSTLAAAAGSCKMALVVGAGGALGEAVFNAFNAQPGWKAVPVDVKESNWLDAITLDATKPWREQLAAVDEAVADYEFDAVVCAAGGWAGGSLADKTLPDSIESMIQLNLLSAVTAAHVAASRMTENGACFLTGAAAALEGTPGMAAYGISKAATHHLVQTLSNQGTYAIAMLPLTIDTPMNRQFMADADFGTWTKPEEMAARMLEWADAAADSRPASGALVKVETENDESTWTELKQCFTEVKTW